MRQRGLQDAGAHGGAARDRAVRHQHARRHPLRAPGGGRGGPQGPALPPLRRDGEPGHGHGEQRHPGQGAHLRGGLRAPLQAHGRARLRVRAPGRPHGPAGGRGRRLLPLRAARAHGDLWRQEADLPLGRGRAAARRLGPREQEEQPPLHGQRRRRQRQGSGRGCGIRHLSAAQPGRGRRPWHLVAGCAQHKERRLGAGLPAWLGGRVATRRATPGAVRSRGVRNPASAGRLMNASTARRFEL
mmetsp:Transcript_4106/g.11242  ORF Transcript_4106/g.11242 Transcript_4106/m.11242 type:complete len:243 (+) Transcript_4106:392-1120(+)